MTTSTRCPRCGATHNAGEAWPDLCPACLLAAAVAVADDACPYQVLAPIEQDPRGITYLAQALTATRAYVALKVYEQTADVAAIRTRWQQWKPRLDAFADRRFSRLLDLGTAADGRLFVVTEYAAGWSLPALVSRPAFDADARLALTRHLLHALAEAHAAGLAHGSLTPAKVRCATAAGSAPRVLGLGTALVLGGVTVDPEPDRRAALSLIHWLGLDVPDQASQSLAALAAALSRR